MALLNADGRYIKLYKDGRYEIYCSEADRIKIKNSTPSRIIIHKYKEIISELLSNEELHYYDPDTFDEEYSAWVLEYEKYAYNVKNHIKGGNYPLMYKIFTDIDGKVRIGSLSNYIVNKEIEALKDKYIDTLACGLINFANAYRPEVILLGGGVCAQGDNLIVPLQKKMNEEIFAGSRGPQVPILIAKLENSAGILGAAALLME